MRTAGDATPGGPATRQPLPEHVALLRERAAALARVPVPQRAAATFAAVLFRLGQESYALDARVILQVAILRELTPLPGARPPLFGVTHWRGDVLAVIDLRAALGATVRGITDLSRMIVVDAPGRRFGMLADAVTEMRAVSRASIHALEAERGAEPGLLLGMTEDAVLVIDPDTLQRAYATRTAPGENRGRGG